MDWKSGSKNVMSEFIDEGDVEYCLMVDPLRSPGRPSAEATIARKSTPLVDWNLKDLVSPSRWRTTVTPRPNKSDGKRTGMLIDVNWVKRYPVTTRFNLEIFKAAPILPLAVLYVVDDVASLCKLNRRYWQAVRGRVTNGRFETSTGPFSPKGSNSLNNNHGTNYRTREIQTDASIADYASKLLESIANFSLVCVTIECPTCRLNRLSMTLPANRWYTNPPAN